MQVETKKRLEGGYYRLCSSIPKLLHKRMQKFGKTVNWSAVVVNAVETKLKELEHARR